jgi:hypothetical protein
LGRYVVHDISGSYALVPEVFVFSIVVEIQVQRLVVVPLFLVWLAEVVV